jgi:hypothetical protein
MNEWMTNNSLKSSVFWDIKPCSPLKVKDSEEHIASIFWVEETAEQETAVRISNPNNLLIRKDVV